MVNGQWSTVNGQWSMVNAKFPMVNGQGSMVEWSMVEWSMVEWSMFDCQKINDSGKWLIVKKNEKSLKSKCLTRTYKKQVILHELLS